MYESKYKYKHAERRVISEKAETFIYRTDPVILKPFPRSNLQGLAAQQQLAGLSQYQQSVGLANQFAGQPQNQMNASNPLGGLFGGAAFLG